MRGRIELAGGEERFLTLLDEFFGYGAEPVNQLGERPSVDELAAGYALNRFEGLNNEPDMEVPWAYHYLGRPDRTAEVVHAAINNQFGLGRGGLPGNDDSGGLAAWYVWASLGLFPVAGQSLYLVNAPSFAHVPVDLAGRQLEIDTEGFVSRSPTVRPHTSSPSRSTASHSNAPGCPPGTCTRAVGCRSVSARSPPAGAPAIRPPSVPGPVRVRPHASSARCRRR